MSIPQILSPLNNVGAMSERSYTPPSKHAMMSATRMHVGNGAKSPPRKSNEYVVGVLSVVLVSASLVRIIAVKGTIVITQITVVSICGIAATRMSRQVVRPL